MKKLLLVLFVTLFSLNIFADSRTCEVWNAGKGGVRATIRNTTANVDNLGLVTVCVDLSAKVDGKATDVVVNVYDIGGAYITSETITIPSNITSQCAKIQVGDSHKICTFKINNASCM